MLDTYMKWTYSCPLTSQVGSWNSSKIVFFFEVHEKSRQIRKF